MRNLLCISLVASILFFSCQKEKTIEDEKAQEEIASTFDSTALTTTTVDENVDQSFFFKYKFAPGESFKYRLTTISERNQSITTDSTMSDKLTQTIIFILNLKTLSLDADSVAELQCTFSSVNLKANANGIDINYQSGSKMDSTKRQKFPEYESFLNIPFNLRVGKQGEIIDIYKFDKIMNKFLSLRGLSDSLTAQEKIMAQQDMTNNSVKPLLAQIFREVPEHKMSKDSTWSYKRESLPIMVFQVDYENLYKVEKLEMLGDEKLAVIDGTIKIKVNGSQTYNEKGINYFFEKPISSASGKIYFNLDKGLIQKSRSQTKMENSYSMEMSTPEGVKKARAKEVTSNVNVIELL
ncbi:MAG: hypothetical protein IH618_01360 [Ignavibacteriaceae bacterium]|nr:hypothetical protein [Ignavibacteriaceae bacterium]